MNNDQEKPLAALLSYLEGQLSATFKTFDRRLRTLDDLPEQPALIVRHTASEDVWTGTVVQKSTVEAEIWVYTDGAGPDDVSDTDLNAAVLAVRNALAPDAFGNPVVLKSGGVTVARYVRIEGRSEYYSAGIDSQSLAILPVKLLLP